MEIIWLQRPHENIPWGFRLQGGREFGQPLAVQRVSIFHISHVTRGISLPLTVHLWNTI